jgi:hypothetical protein
MALDEDDLGLYDPDLTVALGQLFFEGGRTLDRQPCPFDELSS